MFPVMCCEHPLLKYHSSLIIFLVKEMTQRLFIDLDNLVLTLVRIVILALVRTEKRMDELDESKTHPSFKPIFHAYLRI